MLFGRPVAQVNPFIKVREPYEKKQLDNIKMITYFLFLERKLRTESIFRLLNLSHVGFPVKLTNVKYADRLTCHKMSCCRDKLLMRVGKNLCVLHLPKHCFKWHVVNLVTFSACNPTELNPSYSLLYIASSKSDSPRLFISQTVCLLLRCAPATFHCWKMFLTTAIESS